MVEEIKTVEKNHTWDLVENSGKKEIDVRCFYKLKLRPDGKIFKYKGILGVKGFLQKPGVNVNKVYAHITMLKIIRLVVAIATYKGWKMHQLDVKSAFLNGPLEE